MTEDDRILADLIDNPNELISTEKYQGFKVPKVGTRINKKPGKIHTVEPSTLAKTPLPGARQSSTSAASER